MTGDDLSGVRQELERLGATRVRVEMPDTDGTLRGKYVSADKILSGKGASVSDVFYALTIADDVIETSPLTGPETGWPDVVGYPDWETLRPVPWEDRLAAVVCDVRTKAGEPLGVDPRLALHRTCERLGAAGFEARVGVEYELFVFHLDAEGERALREGRVRELQPISREWQAYSLFRWPEKAPFIAELTRFLEAYGCPIEAISTELGYGMIELAIGPAPPLEAADRAARLKLGCKEMARRHGLLASFIAKWDIGQSGSSGHVHQSLFRDGRNAFWRGPGELSETGRHYLGGLVAVTPELSAFMSPFPNSYRRYIPDTWAPPNASWGHDNRNACIRAVTVSEGATRLEHRRPGADLNPYLSVAACLDAGLHGIAERIEPPPESPGRAYDDPNVPMFPASLPEAAAALRASSLARDWYGDLLVDHYAASREAEQGFWEKVRDAQVPEWEAARYLEVV
jgi:glutamine synthetase